MIYLMYKSAKFGLVLTVTYLQIYIYIYIYMATRPTETDQYCLPNTIVSVLNQALPFRP